MFWIARFLNAIKEMDRAETIAKMKAGKERKRILALNFGLNLPQKPTSSSVSAKFGGQRKRQSKMKICIINSEVKPQSVREYKSRLDSDAKPINVNQENFVKKSLQ